MAITTRLGRLALVAVLAAACGAGAAGTAHAAPGGGSRCPAAAAPVCSLPVVSDLSLDKVPLLPHV